MQERTPHLHGAAMRDRRQSLGITKAELAARCGVGYSHIDNIEYSRRAASVERRNRIARELDIKLEDLMCHEADCLNLEQHRERHAPKLVRRPV